MRRWLPYAVAAAAALAALGWAYYASLPPDGLKNAQAVDRAPHLKPDYAGVTLPPNIAPLNFIIDEPGEEYFARWTGTAGAALEVRSRSPSILIPAAAWRRFLAANRGDATVDLYVKAHDGGWRRFQAFTQTIADAPIDGHLVYRLLGPIHNKFWNIAIYQRNLEGFRETPVADNGSFDHACINCHTFCGGDPSRMILHVRGPHGPAMILARGGQAVKVDTRTAFNPSPAGYASWHPSGRLLAFSVNALRQLFHTTGEIRDVFDAQSDLAVYQVDSNTVTTAPAISKPDRNETWPAWSADGRYLYFCAAPNLPLDRFREVKYDLMRVRYDLETNRWDEAETVLAARDTGLSILEPRPSPDGRWLLFCMCEYGNFPIYQRSCDLHLMDLATGRHRRLACNSTRCDSYHSWSSNSRWIVFSSKRDNDLLARPYFAYVDDSGEARKPFVLPQEDPAFYDSFLKTYNAPELATAPVPVTPRQFARIIREPGPQEELKAALDPQVPVPTARAPPMPAELLWTPGRQQPHE